MKLPEKFLILALVFLSSHTNAQILDSEQQSSKGNLTFGLEIMQLKVEGETIESTGGKIAYQRNFLSHGSSEVFLSSTLNAENGLKPGTTTLAFYGFYNIFDTFSGYRTISADGKLMLKDKYHPHQQIKLGIGIEQVFLSGSRGVYNAAGSGLQAIYERDFFSWRSYVGFRSTTLQTNELKVDGSAVNLGLIFDL